MYFDLSEHWQKNVLDIYRLSLTDSVIISYKPYFYYYSEGKIIGKYYGYPDSSITTNIITDLIEGAHETPITISDTATTPAATSFDK